MSTTTPPNSNGGIPAPPLAPPRVPDHELLRRIGKGAYGEVWLARSVTGAFRAVKIVYRASFDHDRPFEREFEGILKSEPISRRHDSQVDILHVGRNGDCFYYVMELADDQATGGQIHPAHYTPRTLKSDLLFHGRLPFEECVHIGVALATALEHLHANSLVHRDVKPSNIIFVNGVAKLADIGLVTGVDATRSFVGTEGFAAPEGAGTPQADLYSLGKVLYEAATGKDRQEFPELPTQLRELPDREGLMELNAVIARTCRHDPKDRYASAAAMRADLELLQSGKSLARLHRTEKRLRFVQRAGAAVTALAAVIAAGWLWQAKQTQTVRELVAERAARTEEDRNRIVRMSIANGTQLLEADDPAGALLWFADALPLLAGSPEAESVHRIRIQQTLAHTPRIFGVFPHESGLAATAFSPDGRRVATGTRDGNVRVWNVADGSLSWGPKQLGAVAAFVRFSQDGTLVFASSSAQQGVRNGTILTRNAFAVFDAESGAERFTAARVGSDVTANLVAAVFSPDDRWVALSQSVSPSNHVVLLFDPATGRQLTELDGHTDLVGSMAFNAEGSLLASASLDRTVRLWQLPSGEAFGPALEHPFPVVRVLLTDDGRHLVSGSLEYPLEDGAGEVRVWNVLTRQSVGEPILERDRFGLFVAPGAQDRLYVQNRTQDPIRVYSLETGAELPVQLEIGGVLSWDFSQDGTRLALGNGNHRAQVFDARTGAPVTQPFRHSLWGITSVQFSPDGSLLLTGCEDGSARVWDLNPPSTESAGRTLPAGIRPVNTDVSLVSVGRWAGGQPIPLEGGTVLVIDDQLEDVHRFAARGPEAQVVAAYNSPDGLVWAIPEYDARSGEATGALQLRVRRNGEWLEFDLHHPTWIQCMSFTPDSRHLITVGADDHIRVWKTSDGGLQRVFHARELAEGAVVGLSPQTRTGLYHWRGPAGEASSRTDRYRFLDLDSGRLVGESVELPATIFRTLYSPCGSRVAILDELGPVTILESGSGRVASSTIRHPFPLRSALWERDGRRLLTTGRNDEVLIWDAETGQLLLRPLGIPDTSVGAAHWSHDGRFIITTSDDHKVRIWDSATGDLVTPPLRHSYYVNFAYITRHQRLITGMFADQLRAWDLKETPLPADVLGDYARLLSGRRLGAGGTMVRLTPPELHSLAAVLRVSHPEFFAKSP
jgi:WD40 repeat protein